MNKEFRLPDVGEGLTEADIVSWHVKPGNTVTINQVIVEIETAKAVVELPSPYAGTVSALLVDEGQTVDVGIPIITIDVPVAGEAAAADAAPAKAETRTGGGVEPPAAPATPAPPARQPVLVGYGVKPGSTSRRARKAPPTRPGSYPASPSAPVNGGVLPGTSRTPSQPPGVIQSRALAKPPVRRLARDLGIDLTGLTGSGPEGSVTKDDVQKAAGGATVRSTPRSFEEPAAGPHAGRRAQPGRIRGR